MPLDPLSEEQREIRELVRTLARERVAPRAHDIDKSAEFPWDMVGLLREQELFGLPYEERHGGTGTGSLMLLVAIEELSKVCATTGLLLAVQELGTLATPAFVMKRLPPFRTYSPPSRRAVERIAALSEPDPGSVSAYAASHSPLASLGR